MPEHGTLELIAHGKGVLLPVRAQPGARKNALTGIHAGQLKVSVTQVPERGKANSAILNVLAKSLGLKRSQICLHTGETNREKMFLIENMTAPRLQELLNDHWS